MFDYLLKSGACLVVFYLFYILFLEKENMHLYKRIYLLAAIVVSFVIPFITFTNYVEVTELIQPIVTTSVATDIPLMTEQEPVFYLPEILWTIYGLGVLIFGIKFIKNLVSIINKIRKNPIEKKKATISVLLKEDIVPHTFFNFIFFNRKKYKTRQIPEDVILHEQTHAKQKHSIDVLLLEVLQVIFWFNPILYLIKNAVKLNHEFLADQAVLNKGTQTHIYQNTLLAYSSNAYQLPLANAINYSSIKKRFTVMRTHTSKKKIWIRSFILLPLLALLLYSFSTTVQQEKATPKQVAEYNALAKKYNNQPANNRIIKLTEVNRLEQLYDLMTPTQKAKAEKFPNIPPMPPSPEIIKGVNDTAANIPPPPPMSPVEFIKHSAKKGHTFYHQGFEISSKQAIDIARKNDDINLLAKENKVTLSKEPITTKTINKNLPTTNNLPKNADYLLDNKKVSYEEASKVNNNNIASVDVANRDGNGNKLEKPLVYIYTKKPKKKVDESERPITSINGIGCVECVLELTKEKLANIVLSVDKGEILKFNIKFPKRPTVRVANSNVLNDEAKQFLDEAEIGQMVQIFGLKSSTSKQPSPPVLFIITE